MLKNNLNRDVVVDAILNKFTSLTECAEAIGSTKQGLDSGLKHLSKRFLKKLESVGVVFGETEPQYDISELSELKEIIIKMELQINQKDKLITELLKKVGQLEADKQALGVSVALTNKGGHRGGVKKPSKK